MKVFKFGGASVKDSESVKNIVSIIKALKFESGVIVVSAMGKMTNAFEKIVQSYCKKESSLCENIDFVRNFHLKITNELFEDKIHPIFLEIDIVFGKISHFLAKNQSINYDFIYDQIVPFGEILSTKIVSAYLKKVHIPNKWINAGDCIITDKNYRNASVNWEQTYKNIDLLVKKSLYVTQGFIAKDVDGNTTTLGREGSDFTAAIFAYCKNAESVTVWKDVEGVLNADPRYFSETVLLPQISYKEAIEMAFYGASVIHPKTLKPLQNKNIPLYVKSFQNPKSLGTVIGEVSEMTPKTPCFVVKKNQILISIVTKDFSFMVEDNLSDVFRVLHKYKIKVNMMQNSAISFSVCVADKYNNISELISNLKQKYNVSFYEGTTLYTVRYASGASFDFLLKKDDILLKQTTEHITQMVVK